MAYKAKAGESQWEARNRVARAKGFANYGEQRRASADERARAAQQLARRDPSYARTGAARQAGRRPPTQRTDLGEGRSVVHTRRNADGTWPRSDRPVLAALRAGEAEQLRATITATVLVGITRRTVSLFSKGAYDAGEVANSVEAVGYLAYLANQLAQVYALEITADSILEATLYITD